MDGSASGSSILVFLLHVSTTLARPGYGAAVIHFSPTLAPNQRISVQQAHDHNLANLARASKYVAAAAKNGSLIVVLPEYGITGARTADGIDFTRAGVAPFSETVPEPGSRPCGACPDCPVTSAAACMAKEHRVVLVIDLVERTADGREQYNTAVAFDGGAGGLVVGKYRKHHLWGSEFAYLDKGASPNGTSFETSFGVRFGMFICYDLDFLTPRADLLDWVFPTDWANEAGWDNATYAQQKWSRAYERVLLASNYGGSILEDRPGGSGIWWSGSALAEFTTSGKGVNASRVLTAEVPEAT